MSPKEIHIDLDRLLENARRGVRRAAIFMGLGINAALDADFRNYELTTLSQIQLVPSNLPEETVSRFKEEFRLWVEAAGLRELVESFAAFLDGVHDTCLLVSLASGKLSIDAAVSTQKKFEKEGLARKLNLLEDRFNLKTEYAANLLALMSARNCLAHRLGVVGDEDLDSTGVLAVSWLGMDFVVEEPDGARTIFVRETPPLFLERGGSLALHFVERVRLFSRGEKVLLTTNDLAEICWFYGEAARTLMASVNGYFKDQGVKVSAKQT